jgi:putative SOS response-associated peptidase YedK
LWTCTVITTQAKDTLGEIHDRCPVVVPPELQSAWLDCSSGKVEVARELLDAMPEPRLEPRIVSSAVNSVRNNGPQLVEPAEPPDVPEQPTLDL